MQNDRSSRRRHSAQLKAQVMSECAEPGASVAAIALAHGLNANLVRQWLRGRGVKRTGAVVAQPSRRDAVQQFVPLTLPQAVSEPTPATIRVEVQRGPVRVQVSWPQSDGAQCAAWLRELLR